MIVRDKIETQLKAYHCPFCLSIETIVRPCKNGVSHYFYCCHCKTKTFFLENLLHKIDCNYLVVRKNRNLLTKVEIENIEPISVEKVRCPFCGRQAKLSLCKTKHDKKFRWKCHFNCGSGFLFEDGLIYWLKLISFLDACQG